MITSDKVQLLKKTNGRCAYCGEELWKNGWHVDHMEPRGGNGFENLIPSCPRCNIRKSSRDPERFKFFIRESMKKRLFKNLDRLDEFLQYSPKDKENVWNKWIEFIDAIENAELLFFFETLGGETPEYF